MERIVFLLEDGARLSCMLNPSSLIIRRKAGLEQRRSGYGNVTGAGLSDAPVVYTGGGVTELVVELLFDLAVAGSSIQTDDVRDLTAPLWKLAENRSAAARRPPTVRFVWGTSWNIPAVVAAIAERLELFSETGAARRSYLTMQLLRIPETEEPPATSGLTSTELDAMPRLTPDSGTPQEDVVVHTVAGAGSDASGRASSERLDVIAHDAYGDAGYWRLIAYFNGISDPLAPLGGRTISLPPRSLIRGDA